jgi:DNA-binding transcriptional ArsR family regulator
MTSPTRRAAARREPGWQPLDELFAAVADPTRRQILQRLVHDGPQTATQLAAHFPLSRQAIVKHVQTLGAAGLVAPTRAGREVRYRATTEQLSAAVAWLLDTSTQWDRRADRLRATAPRRSREGGERAPADG